MTEFDCGTFIRTAHMSITTEYEEKHWLGTVVGRGLPDMLPLFPGR